MNYNNKSFIMENNEFRLGNWVKPQNDSGKESNEGEVFSVNAHLVSVVQNKNPYDFHIVKPIALTSDWLTKFGFKLIDDKYYSKNTQNGVGGIGITKDYNLPLVLVVTEKEPNGVYRQVIGKPIIYVHQLQNLYFALTGEELEVIATKE